MARILSSLPAGSTEGGAARLQRLTQGAQLVVLDDLLQAEVQVRERGGQLLLVRARPARALHARNSQAPAGAAQCCQPIISALPNSVQANVSTTKGTALQAMPLPGVQSR